MNRFFKITTMSALLIFSCTRGSGQVADGTALASDSSRAKEQPKRQDLWDRATLVWADEFDGTHLDTTKWSYETGGHGWGNHEWQNYVRDSNVAVGEGTLKILAKKVGDGQNAGDYTSARLNSRQSFTHGRMEIRAKLPEHKGNGLWPALWMLGSSIGEVGWPACGEIDIMEYVSYDPGKFHFTLHSSANNHRAGTQITSGPISLPGIEDEFHNYGILLADNYLKFYLDEIDNVKLTFLRPEGSNLENWPFSNPFYFIMNIAVGGDWGGKEGVDDSIFPATMEVDYVRVYQVNLDPERQ